jgi:hypothetical protein
MLVSDRARSVWLRCDDGGGVNRLCAAASLLIINVLSAIECERFGLTRPEGNACGERLQEALGKRGETVPK